MTLKQKREYMARYRRKNRMKIREMDRMRRMGQNRRWWNLACLRAGVPIAELHL